MLAVGRTTGMRAARLKRRSPTLPSSLVVSEGRSAIIATEPDKWDGTRPQGWCSGWIHDGTRGFEEHQKGFLFARTRC